METLGKWLTKPIALVASLFDLLLIPLQRVLGTQRMGYFFVLPNLLVFGIFILLPMLLNFAYGFTGGESILLENRNYAGMANFEALLECDTSFLRPESENFFNPNLCQQDRFWRAAANTASFVVFQVGIMVLLALVSALALHQDVRGRGFFRSVYFYPVMLSPVVVALIWKWILQPEGVLNGLLVGVGLERLPFLVDATWARLWVIFVSVWAQMGFHVLILLAGLQSIPRELYEAAEMDGANRWHSFRNVTLPLLMPTLVVVLVLSLIRAVQVFDQVFVLTTGGPGTSTLYMVQYIFQTAFDRQQYGLAAAASLLLAIILFLLTVFQLRLGRTSEIA